MTVLGPAPAAASAGPQHKRHLSGDDNFRTTPGAGQAQAPPRRSPQRDRRVYLLRLQGGADIRPLRTALKILKRRFGLRVLSIEEAR